MAYKRSDLLPITAATTARNASGWLRIIRYTESGIVVQLQDDCEYRVPQVIKNSFLLRKYLGPYFRKYLFLHVQLDKTTLEKTLKETIIKCLKERKIKGTNHFGKMEIGEIFTHLGDLGFEVGLFISRATHLLEEKGYHTLLQIEYLLQQTKNLSVLLFLEKDIARPPYEKLFDKCSLLFDHLFYYPLYEEEDIRHFIAYYSRHWNFHLTKDKENRIVADCGGYLWFVNQAHKYLRDHPQVLVEEALGNELMLQKLLVVWDKFTPGEKDILKKISLGTFSPLEKKTNEYVYLQKIRMIEVKNGRQTFAIPLLKKIIDRESASQILIFHKGKIIYGQNDISVEFSKSEQKILVLLLRQRKKLVSRDEVAKALWGDREECYSDWAIDRLFSRLRKKFSNLGIDQKLIKTVKRKGFIYG